MLVAFRRRSALVLVALTCALSSLLVVSGSGAPALADPVISPVVFREFGLTHPSLPLSVGQRVATAAPPSMYVGGAPTVGAGVGLGVGLIAVMGGAMTLAAGGDVGDIPGDLKCAFQFWNSSCTGGYIFAARPEIDTSVDHPNLPAALYSTAGKPNGRGIDWTYVGCVDGLYCQDPADELPESDQGKNFALSWDCAYSETDPQFSGMYYSVSFQKWNRSPQGSHQDLCREGERLIWATWGTFSTANSERVFHSAGSLSSGDASAPPMSWHDFHAGLVPLSTGLGALFFTVECKRPDATTYYVTNDPDAGGGYQYLTPPLIDESQFWIPPCQPGDVRKSIQASSTSYDSEGNVNGGLSVTDGTEGYPLTCGIFTAGDCSYGFEPDAEYPNGVDASCHRECALFVVVDGVPCTVGRALCLSWADLSRQAPERVKCTWTPPTWGGVNPNFPADPLNGVTLLPISDCAPLQNQYVTGTTGSNPDNPWGVRPAIDPETGLPVENPTPRFDPNTNTSVPETDNPWKPAPVGTPNPAPQPDTGTDPGTDPGPGPGTGTRPQAPSTEPSLNGSPDSENCWAGAVSWNPIDWVYVPIKCSLTWAFVPSSGHMAETFADLSTDFTGTAFGDWLVNIVSVADALGDGPGGDSCMGPGLSIDLGFIGGSQETLHPFAACTSPMSFIASVVRTALTVSFWMGGAFFSVKALAASFGLNLGTWGRSEGTNV